MDNTNNTLSRGFLGQNTGIGYTFPQEGRIINTTPPTVEEKKYGPVDLASYFTKGIATGTKSTAKNFLTVLRSNAIESDAMLTADILKYYENKLQGAIEGGYGAADEGVDFAKHPAMATAYNVGAGIPLMTGAIATTVATKNPLASIAMFAVPSFGSFYDQATSNGVKHEDAMKLATANMLMTGASVAVPMGQFSNMFKYASGKALKSVIASSALMGAEMGAFNVAQATGEGVLRNIGWDDPNIINSAGETFAAGMVTGAIMGGAVQQVVNTSKNNFIRSQVEAIKSENPGITPQELKAKTQQAIDIFDKLSEVVSRDPTLFLNKFHEAIGLPVTLTKLSGAKGSKVQVETIVLGDDAEMRAGERVYKPLLKKDKEGRTEDYPLTYTHYLLREAINNLRLGKTEQEARMAVKDFKENTLDTWSNVYVMGSTGRAGREVEIWNPITGNIPISKFARRLKDYERPQGSILPSELTYFSHGLVDSSGKFIENSIASSKIDALLRGEYSADTRLPMKVDSSGNKMIFRENTAGEHIPDAVSKPEDPSVLTFSQWKKSIDGKDMSQVLNTIKGEAYTPLAETLRKYLRKAGIEYQVLIQGTDISEGKIKARARTNPRDRTVNLYHDALIDVNSTKEAAGVLLHEAVHVATLDILSNYELKNNKNTEKQNEYAKNIHDLYQSTLDQIPADDLSAIKRMQEGEQPTEAMKNNLYGLTDVHEFVTEGLTNKAFQEKLNNIFVDDGKTTVWQKFKKAVVDILNSIAEVAGIEIKDNSVLSKLVDNVYGMLEGEDIKVETIKEKPVPSIVPEVIQMADNIKQIQALTEEQQAIENQKIAEKVAEQKVKVGKAVKNYEKKMKPQKSAKQVQHEAVRTDMAKNAMGIVEGTTETVDLKGIVAISSEPQITKEALVAKIGDNYKTFISNVESLYEQGSEKAKDSPSSASALAWFNDLLKSEGGMPSENTDVTLGTFRNIRAFEAKLKKAEQDKSEELKLAKNDMDVARINDKWNPIIARNRNNADILKKVLGPMSGANAILARNMFLEYQKSVNSLLKKHGIQAEFLYENPEILSNPDLFWKKVETLAVEKLPEPEAHNDLAMVRRQGKLEEPVFGRLDLPIDDVPAGIYRITHTGENFVLENSTIKKTLTTDQMNKITNSIAFQLDEPTVVRDFLDPQILKEDKVIPPPDLAGQPKPPTSMVEVKDNIGLNRNFENFTNWFSDTIKVVRRAPTKERDLIDQILAPLMWSLKGEGQNWSQLAASILQPQDAVFAKVLTEIAPLSNIAKQGLKGRELNLAVREHVAFAMTKSAEEFAVAKVGEDGTADIGSTMVGIGYEWEPGEMERAMRDVKVYSDAMGIPFDLNQLQAGRPRRLWSDLLKQADPRFFQLLVYNKAHVEYPLVMAGIDVGLFSSHAMAARILSGYVHRVWEEGEEQQVDSKSFRGTGGGKSARSPRRYSEERSYTDWVDAARNRSRLVVYTDYLAISKDYIREYGTLIMQHNYLNRMKDFKVADPDRIADVIIAECKKKVDSGDTSYNIPDRNELIKETRMLGIIDYQDSAHINRIAKMTQVKGKEWSGFNTGGIFSMLEMRKSTDAPGFAKFVGTGFEAPFVTRPVLELMDAVFSPRMGTLFAPANAINNFLSYYKRGVSINPLDSPFLFKTAELVNTNPVMWVPNIFWPYMKDVGGSMWMAGTDAVKLVQNKKLDSTKVWEPTALLETPEDRRLFTIMRKYGGGHLINVANLLTAIYEKSDINKFDSTLTRREEAAEYFTSVLGINNEIFKRNIIPSLVKVTLNRMKALIKKGYSEEDAARIANNYVQNASGLRSPHLYGVEGDILNWAYFARGLTNGFIAQITGAAYLPLKKVAPGLARNIYRTHTGKLSRMVNPFIHAEMSPKLLEQSSIIYMQHLGKVFGMGLVSYGAIQYLLSFGDDDKMDEHGQIARGDPWAKKRWMWNNEKGRRSSIRTADKDENQRRDYINPQFDREFRQLVDIMGNFGSESMPEGLWRWHKNRLNSFAELMIAGLTGVDVGLGEKIIKDDSLPYIMKGELMAKYTIASMTPFGFGREDALPVAPDNPTASRIFSTIKYFGVSTTKGAPMEEGVTAEQVNQAKENLAVKAFYDEEMREEMQGKTVEEKMRIIKEKYPYLSKSQYRSIIFKGHNPGQKIIRSGNRAKQYLERNN